MLGYIEPWSLLTGEYTWLPRTFPKVLFSRDLAVPDAGGHMRTIFAVWLLTATTAFAQDQTPAQGNPPQQSETQQQAAPAQQQPTTPAPTTPAPTTPTQE